MNNFIEGLLPIRIIPYWHNHQVKRKEKKAYKNKANAASKAKNGLG